MKFDDWLNRFGRKEGLVVGGKMCEREGEKRIERRERREKGEEKRENRERRPRERRELGERN
jgi:hypothetical protein